MRALLLALLVSAAPAWAEVYKCKGASGARRDIRAAEQIDREQRYRSLRPDTHGGEIRRGGQRPSRWMRLQ